MRIQSFTGGIFDTNSYVVETTRGTILFDAPQDVADWLDRESLKIDWLLLTHGHYDHVVEAARVRQEHGCKVAYHPDGRQMLTEPEFFRMFGFEFDVEPVQADEELRGGRTREWCGVSFELLEVPGHCPGSVCFLNRVEKFLIGGDVLFAGGIGRWDLPGGDRQLLLSGIREKLLPLDDAIRVLPGHGPPTTIGEERRTNPFLS